MWFNILQGLGAIVGIATALKDVRRGFRGRGRAIVRAFRNKNEKALILVADFKGDEQGRWKGEVVDLLSSLKKRQHPWQKEIDADYGTDGYITYRKGLSMLARYKYDVLITGRVKPGGLNAKVTILANQCGLVGEVVLSATPGAENCLASIDELNKAVEVALVLAMERGKVGNGKSIQSLKETEFWKKRLENMEEQLIEEMPLQVTQLNRAHIELSIGDRDQNTSELRKARNTFMTAYQEEWFIRRRHKQAEAIAHSFVFESRITGEFYNLPEAVNWYRTAAAEAEGNIDYQSWISNSVCIIGTCLECYQCSGDPKWLEKADQAREGLLERAAERLTPDEAREAYEVSCYCRAIRSAYLQETEELMFALENLRDYGRIDLMRELSNVGTTSEISNVVRSVLSLEEERRHWQGEARNLKKEDEPSEWALVQNRIGICYAESGERDEDPEQYWMANRYFLSALTVWTESEAPWKYAMVMDNLGTMYYKIYSLTEDIETLRKGVHAHQQSLKHRDETTGMRAWISTARNASSALSELARIESAPKHIDNAIALLERAMNILLAQSDFDMLYDIRVNLATAYDARFQLCSKNSDREAAVILYHQVLAISRPGRTGDATRLLRRRIATLEKREQQC